LANSAWRACTINRGRVARGAFPPHEVAQVKAIACELPKTHGVPLSRFSRSELHRFVVEQAISEASASTIGRWLTQDAIRPWRQRSWIFPRDPRFLERAGPILDLYAGRWQGTLLEPGDCIISADAKPSIQARKRIHPTAPPATSSTTATRSLSRSRGTSQVVRSESLEQLVEDARIRPRTGAVSR
jgi:hypothetical protein